MEAVKHKVINMKGKEVGEMTLDPEIFAAPIQQSLVHEVSRWQQAKKRSGTHSTLNRSKMTGGGKKPFRQKGTGRARAGTKNSPLWVGGAVAHGPQPHKYGGRISKRARRQALFSVLTDKRESGALIILDSLEVESGKTKDFVEVLKGIGVEGSLEKGGAAVVLSEKNEAVWRSSSNLKKVLALPVIGANVYDLLKHQVLIGTQESIEALQNRLKQKSAEDESK